MLRQFLATTSLFDLPVIAMCMFLAMFACVLVRVCQRTRATQYRRMADLPLADDSNGSD